ncbi:hypothetical protein EZV62_023577 [Acer yangbiense]|uniref:Uncharacterized protein n=1 Tax=Acer yangbiense TaxID=1000413 RepID=A0A5C7H250_9ROSI|nr:hypothetical protein EZV62_023577 [Acer yangbiense]
MFVEYVDVSTYAKTSEKMFELPSQFVEKIDAKGKWAKKVGAKRVVVVMLMPLFWNNECEEIEGLGTLKGPNFLGSMDKFAKSIDSSSISGREGTTFLSSKECSDEAHTDVGVNEEFYKNEGYSEAGSHEVCLRFLKLGKFGGEKGWVEAKVY